MRLLLAGLAFLAVCPAFAQEAATIDSAPAFRRLSDVVGWYGEAPKQVENGGPVNLYYRDFKLWLNLDPSTGTIRQLIGVFHSPAWKMRNGLSVGSTRQEVLLAMGDPALSAPYRLEYRTGGVLYAFNLNGEQLVDQIVVEQGT
jgi:hypothetical protein